MLHEPGQSPFDNPSTAVIVLNWNRPVETITCLESLRASEPRPRVIVVDNGSATGTAEAIREAHPWAQYICLPENLGFGGGMNAGIRCALAVPDPPAFVWVLNNDTQVAVDAFAALTRAATRDSSLGAVGSVLLDGSGTRVQEWGGATVNRLLWTTRSLAGPSPDRLDCLTGASLLLRVAALREIGGFDERFFFYLEDTDLSLRLRRAGWKLAVASDSHVRHALGGTVNGGKHSTDPRAHELYARAVGTFIAIWSPPVVRPLQLLLRLSAMVGVRLARGQSTFVPLVLKSYLEGVRIGLGEPRIPQFG